MQDMINPGDALSRSLLALALGTAGSRSAIRASETVARADEPTWNACLARLLEHQLLPLVWHGLVRHDCGGKVPDAIGARLQQHFERAQIINNVSLETLRAVAGATAVKGVALTVCKGIVLAPEYYPALGARPMNDVDVWISPHELPVLADVMAKSGFVRNDAKSDAGAHYFENSMGIVFDVHVVMDLFAAQADALVTLTRPSPDEPWRVFEPHAFLTHLVVHMTSHARKIGPMVMWMADLWLVLRKIGDQIDPFRLVALLPSAAEWIALLQTIRMLEQVADQAAPAVLSPFLVQVAPTNLDAVWRQRRLATWKLPKPIGWARLAACRLGLNDRDGRHYPSAGELARWPLDWLEAWLARARASHTTAALPVR
jgi:hypothetical protein